MFVSKLLARSDEEPPPRALLFWEAASIFGRFWRAFGDLGERGPAHGQPVFVIPGFFASDRTTLGLQRALAKHGYRVRGWGMGVNRGAHSNILVEIIEELERFTDGRPAIMVGHSLGGVFAREVAKLRSDLVTNVFTMGSPFSGNPRANHAWRLYEQVTGHPVDRPPLKVDVGAKPPAHTVAFWSRRDGMVAPACARGAEDQSDERIEINSSHMGFATDGYAIRQVVRAIVERCPPKTPSIAS